MSQIPYKVNESYFIGISYRINVVQGMGGRFEVVWERLDVVRR
jgi:hypothetical protein